MFIFYIYIPNLKLNCPIKHYKTFEHPFLIILKLLLIIRLYYWKTLNNSVWFEWGIGCGAWELGRGSCRMGKWRKCKITNLNKYWMRKKEKSVMWVKKNILYLRIRVEKQIQIYFYKKTSMYSCENKTQKSHFNKSICTTDTRPTPGLVKLENHLCTRKTYLDSIKELPIP